MDSEAFSAKLNEIAPVIEAALGEWALPGGEPVVNLDEGVRYALGLDVDEVRHRGKRLRPALAVLSCEALGGSRDQVLPFAAAVELMHNGFLVHDDIEDGDEMRHGRPTVWRRFGVAHAINIGDYLQTRVNAVVLESLDYGVDPSIVLRLLRLLAVAFDHTQRGQALDLNARSATDYTVEKYLAMVTEKTGHYLAAPILGGAVVAGADSALLAEIGDFSEAIGPMFQIVDDLIDLTEGKGRGEKGADVREGKRSFLVAHALARLDPLARMELLKILDCPRQTTMPPDIARAMEFFQQTGAIEEARALVKNLGRRARLSTDRMPEPLRELLRGTTVYLERRSR